MGQARTGRDRKGREWVVVAALAGAAAAFVLKTVSDYSGRRRERGNTTRALLIEIRNVNTALAGRREWYKRKEHPGSWLPPLAPFFAPVYDRLVEKISMVDVEIAEEIVTYHGHLAFINRYHGFREEYVKEGKAKEFYDRYLGILEEQEKRGQNLLARFCEGHGLPQDDN